MKSARIPAFAEPCTPLGHLGFLPPRHLAAIAALALVTTSRTVPGQAAHDRITDHVDGLGVSEDPGFGTVG
ncbi:MAG: hypothetical protein JK586_17320 [Nocardiopsis sp. BM-2018]|nr:MAG: hypothetical protein JK586_17320 [Nocardiopsis sp. BM-2018]